MSLGSLVCAPNPGMAAPDFPKILTNQQVARGFHGILGFLNVFEKCDFTVIAAPTAGLEQFGQMLEPLLGERARARDNVATPRHV